jgi:MFS family permease
LLATSISFIRSITTTSIARDKRAFSSTAIHPGKLEIMHQVYEKGPVKAKTFWMVLTMCMASASMGMTASVISTTLGQPSFIKKMALDGPNGASLTGAVTSMFYVGATWGAFVHGWFANRYGRKPSIIFAVGVITVSQALLAGSVNVAMFIVFRFFLGWGYAFLFLGPLLSSEG